MGAILVLNSGSSSVKFAAFDSAGLGLIGRGRVAQTPGTDVEFVVKAADGTVLERNRTHAHNGVFDHDKAMAHLFMWLDEHRGGLSLTAVGHRVVHGGQWYSSPVVVNDEVLEDLEALIPLAPLHQHHNLKAIHFLREHLPEVPQVACFDTAFHTTQPRVATTYALPRDIIDAGVRRYGFHGLSYEYIASQLPRALGDAARGKVIVAHLGSGASLCALENGRSVASTMGFSALDGLVMGTRCGSLDPGVVLYLMQALQMTVKDVSDLLYSRSGLLGVSGVSNDMQVLLASTDPRAAEAIDLFIHRIVCEIGSLAAAMGGLDALVFTAGIGERSAPIRSRVVQGCAWLGAAIDDAANAAGRERIEAPGSRIKLAAIPTNEEKMIAAHTLKNAGRKPPIRVAHALPAMAARAQRPSAATVSFAA